MPDFDAVSAADAKRVWQVITDTPNWWLGLAPYEPAQIARLYQLARRYRWEVSFLTSRIPTAGDSVQFQSQAWLEAYGFYMPAVVTVPGLARRDRQRASARRRHRRSVPELPRSGRRVAGKSHPASADGR